LRGQLPGKIPCEIYCHTLTDDSILSPALRREGLHTLTLFGLDVPWSLFAKHNEPTRAEATMRCLAQLNEWLEEPIENSLARTSQGELCIESKSPVDIERELGHYRGNIFHSALKFPFAESPEEAGRWGVETPWPNIFLCGSSAKRGGAVSGIPGHNAARKALEVLRA
jgi:phytoene dehydrogenase-like protein